MNYTQQALSSPVMHYTDKEQVILGITYLGFTLPIIPLYIVLIVAMLTDKELNRNNLYRLSNQLIFVDFGQLLFHIIVSLFIIFPHWERNYQFLARAAACTLNSLWLAMYPIMSALSVSRILVVKEVISPDRFPVAMKVFVAIGWLYTICVWICGCITQNITLKGVCLAYDLTKPGASTFSQLEWYLCLPSLAVSWGAYFVIVLHTQMRRRELLSSSYIQEAKILFQATFLTIYMSALVVIWHYSDEWLKANASVAALHIAWILFLYCNPILLISLNPTIRRKVLRITSRFLNCDRSAKILSATVKKDQFLQCRRTGL